MNRRYKKRPIGKISAHFDKVFFDNDEPISCEIYDYIDGGEHSAIACNLAGEIRALSIILEKLASIKDDHTVSILSPTIINQFNAFREFITLAERSLQNNYETYSQELPTVQEDALREWSGFLKHPGAITWSHKCGRELVKENGETITTKIINTEFITEFSKDHRGNTQKNNGKNHFFDMPVEFILPDFDFYEALIDDLLKRVQTLIQFSKQSSESR